MSAERLPVCTGCGKRLKPTKGRGRPRKWCKESCRAKARRDRTVMISWESLGGEFADASVTDPLTRRREAVEALTALLEGEPAAPPLEQATRVLLELRNVVWLLRRLEADLPPKLAGRFGALGKAIRDALTRSFGEVVDL